MNLTLEEIASYVGGTLEGSGPTEVRGCSIDSRTIRSGELFFAIRGPRFDGHEFVGQAMRHGAAAAVVCRQPLEARPQFPLVRVDSTVQALQRLAHLVRRRWNGTVIGITGSVGKTTVKEMIAAVLGKRFRVLRSIGNMNNEYGVPLSLLRVENYQKVAVLEMGMSRKGELRALAAIAEPDQAVVTNVNPVHLQFFRSVDEIAEAKAEILNGQAAPKVAYLNNDDPRVRAMARTFGGKIVTFGLRSAAAFKTAGVRSLGLDGSAFVVHHGRREVDFVLPLLGQHNVVNAVAAVSVGLTHGLTWEQAREAIGEMKPERMRGDVIRFREGFTVIDDTYNSNPRALSGMIRFLGRLRGFDRKILMAGEMLELGSRSAALHRACGREAARARLDLIVGVGAQATDLLEGARAAGFDPAQVRFTCDAVLAGDFLAANVRSGDVVLLKGSRGVKLEQALDTLRLSYASMEP